MQFLLCGLFIRLSPVVIDLSLASIQQLSPLRRLLLAHTYTHTLPNPKPNFLTPFPRHPLFFPHSPSILSSLPRAEPLPPPPKKNPDGLSDTLPISPPRPSPLALVFHFRPILTRFTLPSPPFPSPPPSFASEVGQVSAGCFEEFAFETVNPFSNHKRLTHRHLQPKPRLTSPP